jgi:hypothetical protein
MILSLDYDYDEDEVFYICYNAKENIFYYDGGYVNFNIFAIMTPNEVYLFKKNKEDILVRAKTGDIYEIFYEDENDEDYEN